MDYEEFISIVKQWADLRDEEAERAIRVVLQTLAERISTGEARDLVSQLPAELGPWLLTEHGGQRFDVDEFLRRVAEHEETDIATAERHVRAVLAALSGALDSDEFADLEAQLPKDYFYLLPRGPDVEVWPVDELLDKISRRAGLDRDGALRATEAVLAAIAERIAPGEVDDLISLLPVPLHAALKRGKTANPGTALHTPLDRFLGRVAELEGSSPEQARDHANAVFLTLREALGNEEFFDVTVQFPPEYAVLWTRRGGGGQGERYATPR
jgi:uncharacterized protein (DUF2267 family)